VVVHAFAEIQQLFPDAKLDLVGKGFMEPQIRNLANELKLSGVNFAGAVPHHEIASYYDAADIFINASSLDNAPVSILEAFASGTPVVTTAPEGMTYLVEHERTGLLSEPGDARALAENVMRLLREPALASRLAFNAHEEVNHYSWHAVRQQWLEVYRSLGTSDIVRATPSQPVAVKLVDSDRRNPESWDSPSTQTRNQSSKFNSRQMRSE
jgi:glycosyltransferase involved in cell wall biosynthesis